MKRALVRSAAVASGLLLLAACSSGPSTTIVTATEDAVEETSPEPVEEVAEPEPSEAPTSDQASAGVIISGQGAVTDASGYTWDLAFSVSDPGEATIDIANAAPGKAMVTVTYPTAVEIINTTADRNLSVDAAYTVVLGWPEGSAVCAVKEGAAGGCYVTVAAARGELVPTELGPNGSAAAPGYPTLQPITLRPTEETSSAVAAELATPQWAAVLRQDSGATGPGLSSFFDVFTVAHSDGAPTDVMAAGLTEVSPQLVVP